MFTGLVETTGTLIDSTATAGARRLTVGAPALAGRWREGDSIAVNGVCLTAIPGAEPGIFGADLAQETVERTTLGSLELGSLVNLELPTPAGAPLGGHVVQGHVDGTGRLLALVALGPDAATADWRLTLAVPEELARRIVPQGSLTVDGISLTVAKVHPMEAGEVRVEIAIIPHTYRSTHLRGLQAGARVNLETDVLARYAAQQRPAEKTEWLTGAYLLANGY